MKAAIFTQKLTCYAALAAATATSPAMAQETQSEESTDFNNEIVVTATKRVESVQDIPISVSVIGGDTLAKSRATEVDDLVAKVANLQMNGVSGANVPIFALRGVSMADFSLNQSSPVATYYDEVYKGNPAFLGVSFYDLKRVEVLRGPQGTLYGKNTTGGAINIISQPPILGETSGYLNAGYGNYDRIEANGAINLPLGDNAALRIAGTIARADGWFENVVPGQPDLASVRQYGVRGSIKVEPRDGIDFVLRASTSFQNPRNYGIYAQPENVVRAGLGERQIASNIADERRNARTYSVSLTGNAELSDTLTLTSITSWDKGRFSLYEDTDGNAGQLLEIPYLDRATQFAQDFRLTSFLDGPFNFVLGAYFNREKVFNRTTLEIGKDIDFDGVPGVTVNDCAIGLPLACLFRNSFTQIKKSSALYADMNFDLSESLTLRGGLRYTHDKGRQIDLRADALGPDEVLLATLIPPTSIGYTEDNLSGKIGLDYQISDRNLLYAHYSRGYRAPSFNAQAFFDPSEVNVADSEKISAYEIGAKTQFADRAVTLNMAAFYYDYRNQQFLNVDPTTAAQTLLSIPKTRILGGEAELTVYASDTLTFRGGIGLLDTKVRVGNVSGVDVSGNDLANASSLTFNLSVDLTLFDNETGKLSFHPDLSYASSQYFDVVNVPRLQQGGYALLGGHIDFETSDGRWNASIWAKNLTNKFYFSSRIDLSAGFGFDYNHIGAPRTYGISVGTKF